MPTGRTIVALIAGAAALFGAVSAQADDYPSRPIRFLVGFAAGGGNDLFARLVTQKCEQNTGAKVVIENKPGADRSRRDRREQGRRGRTHCG